MSRLLSPPAASSTASSCTAPSWKCGSLTGLDAAAQENIHKEPGRFIRAVAGYAMMSNEELGLDTHVERDEKDRYINIIEV